MMNLIKVKIIPHSSFATFPKGDMLFGRFAFDDFVNSNKNFKNYLTEKPKIIFSDFLPDDYLPKPTLPMDVFEVNQNDKKEFKKKAWIKIKDLQEGIRINNKKEFTPYMNLTFIQESFRVRNSLNRKNFKTGDSEEFTPYSLQEFSFVYQPVVYIMHDDSFSKEEIVERLNNIGKVGFGKKGSIGKGHFRAVLDDSFKGFDNIESSYYQTLSPTILHKSKHNIEEAYYDVFSRFGKHHSISTPYKKALIMADSGAVVKLKSKLQYIGGAVDNGISKKSFVQGYSIVIPIKFDGKGLKNG